MPLKKKIFLIVSLLYILYTLVPIVPNLTGLPVWLANLATFIILFTIYPRAFHNRVTYWFLAYASILAVYVLAGKPLTIGIGTVLDSRKILIEFAFILPSLSILSILFFLKDYRLYKFTSYAGLLFIVFSFLYLIPMIISDNVILRVAHELKSTENYDMPGVPNYTLMHAYIIAVPALLYGIKTLNAKKKWVMLAVLTLFVFIILHTYVTTSLIVTFAVIVFALLYNTKNKARSYFLMILASSLIYVLHLAGVYVLLFDFLIDFFVGTAVEPKIEGFKYIYLFGDIKNSGGHITGRMYLHNMSWKAFIENPLMGASSPVGGHSNILDRLGGMGLLPFIPFAMIILSQVKMTLRIINQTEQRMYFYLGFGSALSLLFLKGLFGQEGWLFLMVLMPGLIITFRNSQKNQKEVKLIVNPNDNSVQKKAKF
jgi:hypothetical protein